MQLTFLQTLMQAGDGIHKVTAMCYSPNDKRLAVCLVDRIVYLYDENGERREKFSTKPGDKVRVVSLIGAEQTLWDCVDRDIFHCTPPSPRRLVFKNVPV